MGLDHAGGRFIILFPPPSRYFRYHGHTLEGARFIQVLSKLLSKLYLEGTITSGISVNYGVVYGFCCVHTQSGNVARRFTLQFPPVSGPHLN